MPNIDMKKAAFAAALIFVGYKKMAGNASINNVALTVGALVALKQVPVVGSMV